MYKRKNRSILACLVILSCFIGCAPQLTNMIPRDEDLVFESTGKTIHVTEASGGEDTSPMGASRIGSGDFKAALIQALENSQLFSKIAAEAGSLLYARSSTKQTYESYDYYYDEYSKETHKASGWGFTASADGGVMYMLSNTVALDTELAFQIEVWEPGKYAATNNIINLAVGTVAFLY